MISNFLKKQDYTRLKLLQCIGTRSQTNMQELVSIFNLSRTSIKRNIIDINTFFSSNSDLAHCTITQDSLFNFTLNNSNSPNLNKIYFKYQNYLLNDSLQFKIIKIIFNTNSVSIKQLSSDLFISINRTYKIINQLNNSLHYFKLSIILKNNSLQIIGEEQNIRFMYWLIFVSGSQNISWPFNLTSHNFIKKNFIIYRQKYLLNKPLSTQLRVDFYLTILYSRTIKGNYVPTFNKLSSNLIKIFMNINDITDNITYFPLSVPTIKNKHIEDHERLSFNLLIRILDSQIDNNNHKRQIGTSFINSNNPLTDFHKDLNIAFISKYLNNDKEKLLPIFMYYTVLYHMFSHHYAYSQEELLNINPLNSNNLIYKQTEFSLSMTNFIQSFVDEYSSISFSISPTAFQTIGILHYSLFTSYFKNSLSIYIQYSRVPIGYDFIKSKLLNIFNSDTLIFTSNLEGADIIISDSIEDFNNDAISFFLEDIYNVTLWKELYNLIQSSLFNLHHY